MYTIDLLKGQAVPARANLKMLALMTAAFAILIFAALYMTGSYVHNRIVFMTQQHTLKSYESKFQGLRAVLDERQDLVDKRQNLSSCLEEVADTLKYETQWSQFINVISSYLPKDLTVDQILVKVKQDRIKVEKRSNPSQKMAIAVPVRSVTVSLYCNQQCDGDKLVRDFQQKLLENETFKQIVKSVEIISRQPDVIDKRDVINYILNCTLKTHSL